MKFLVCFDFFDTIIKSSMGWHIVSLLGKGSLDQSFEFIDKSDTIRCFRSIIDNNGAIAIVSFVKDKSVIRPILSKLTIEEKVINEIYIASSGSKFNIEGKNILIKESMNHFGILNNEDVLLYDDDTNNVKLAIHEGYNAILATQNEDTRKEEIIKLIDFVSKKC